EPKGRAAGHRDGVDARHGLRRIEEFGLTRARTAAAHIDRSDRRFVKDDHGRTGTEGGVLSMTDLKPGDVGDQIAHNPILANWMKRSGFKWAGQSFRSFNEI